MEPHLKQLSELICVWTPDGVLSACNDAYCEFLGLRREEVIGRRWTELLPATHRDEALDFMQDFVARPRSFRREQVVRHASGEMRCLLWVAQLITDASGRPLEVLSEGRDITEQKRAEQDALESERRYRRLFEEASEGMVLVSVDNGVVEDCNHAFLRLTGHAREDLVGHPIPLARGEGDGETDAASFADRLSGLAHDSLPLPARILAVGGAVKDVEIKATALQIGNRRLVHAFFHDVTQERVTERYRDATLVLLRLLNEEDQTRQLLRQLTDLVAVWAGCEAVGVRLREGEDFPYFETRGFRPDFVRTDRSLCRLDAGGRPVLDEHGNPQMECLCGRLVSGEADLTLPCFTRRGSFWTNDAVSLRGLATMPRGRCLAEGYQSIALIPLRQGTEVLGLLHLADRSQGRFSEALVNFLEHAGEQIAIALAKRAKLSSLEGGLRQIAALLSEIGVGPHQPHPPLPPALRAALGRLSRRETEVLRLLLRNRRPATIAKELSRSVHTVRNQLKAIFRKLDVHSQEELLNRLGPGTDILAGRLDAGEPR